MTKYYSRSKGKFIDIANMPDQYVRNAFVKMCSEESTKMNSYLASHYKKLAEDNFIASVDDLEKNEIMVGSLTKERADKYKKLAEDNNLLKEAFKGVKKDNNVFRKKANDMEMAKMNINRELLDAKDIIKEQNLAISTLRSSLDNNISDNNKLNEHTLDTVSKQAYQVMWDNCEKLKKDYKYANDRMMNYEIMLYNKCPKGDVKMFSEIPNTDEGWEFVDKLKHYLNKKSYKIRVRGQYLDDETKKNEGWRRYTYGQPIEKSRCLRVYVDINNDK